MHVRHIVPSLEERHGGPSKSTRALANASAALGEKIELLATLEPGQPIAPGPDLASVRTFPRVIPRWLSRSPELNDYLRHTPCDLVHNHALWLLPLHYAHQAARKHKVPLVIAPRGMMSGWAHRHRRWRKQFSEIFVHPCAFRDAAGWHATSRQEANDIRSLGFTQPVCVSPNGVTIPSAEALDSARQAWLKICPAAAHRPVALFYSRLHQKKRVRELIDLWLAQPRGDWLLLIAGVTEQYRAEELNALVRAADATEKIHVVDSAGLPPPYAVASLFILPSHSENFGLVIAEALAASVPALVTNTTPWEGLHDRHAGWCVTWDDFATSLNRALQHDRQVLAAMGARGREWVTQEFSWGKAAAILAQFHRELINGR